MRFVAGGINGLYLREITQNALEKTESVRAAVAYAGDTPNLLSTCHDNNIKLTFWGRYDWSSPVEPRILRWFLDKKSPNYVCRLVPDFFHPKVIWWENYGVYIGSANLTDRGWYGNIEAGTFFLEEELDAKFEQELQLFFAEINSRSHPLTEEIYEEALKQTDSQYKSTQKGRDDFSNDRLLPRSKSLASCTPTSARSKRKANFLQEWNDTLQIMRDISSRVASTELRPIWIPESVPVGVQGDQFLHAYYYTHVMKGNKAHHRTMHEENSADPETALKSAMTWWSGITEAPNQEGITIFDWAPYLYQNLKEGLIENITEDGFVDICSRVHAIGAHALRVQNRIIGAAGRESIPGEEKVQLFARWLFQQRSGAGKSPLETIYYVLYGGPEDRTPERLWEATQTEEWSIPRLKISGLGEMVGWAKPDVFPPRNGRTSKALFALGYDVAIHSE